VASAAGAPARQHLIPGEARQARRRRRGSPPRGSDVARRSHEHPACVPTLWVLREHVKTLDDAWRLPTLYAPLQLRRFDPQENLIVVSETSKMRFRHQKSAMLADDNSASFRSTMRISRLCIE
jgi:hypothetical protein